MRASDDVAAPRSNFAARCQEFRDSIKRDHLLWVVLALGCPGLLRALEVDTAHFRGNYPDRCAVRALPASAAARDERAAGAREPYELYEESADWPVLLPQQQLEADRVHRFERELLELGAVSHLRLDIFPDGGVSRLRAFGLPRPPAAPAW